MLLLEPDHESRQDLDYWIEWACQDYADAFLAFWHLNEEAEGPPEVLTQEAWWERLGDYQAAKRLATAARHLFRPSTLPSSDANLPSFLTYEAESEDRSIRELIDSIWTRFDGGFARAETDEPMGREEFGWRLRNSLHSPASDRLRFFVACLQIEIAGNGPNYGAQARRLTVLVEHLLREEDEEVQRYLDSVARCYLADMGPEMALMARAAMELSLERRWPAEYVRRTQLVPSHRRVGLSHRLDELRGSADMTEVEFAAAERVKSLGDRVAHGELPRDIDTDVLLADLHQVLSAVARNKKG